MNCHKRSFLLFKYEIACLFQGHGVDVLDSNRENEKYSLGKSFPRTVTKVTSRMLLFAEDSSLRVFMLLTKVFYFSTSIVKNKKKHWL